ncbi:MAG: endonuclease MutS2 [Christensenellaceae bacterium]
MIDERTLKSLEFDKVLQKVGEYAVLKRTKSLILQLKPQIELERVRSELDKTEEAFKLLFDYGISGIEFFDDITDELERSKIDSVLNLAELLRVARLLKCSRLLSNSVLAINDETIVKIPDICMRLYCDQYLEKEITTKILSDEKIADNASERLYSIRQKIKKLNEDIREKLNYYLRKGDKYLQDSVVTIRNDRYVIPVKSEYRNEVKGFVHDKSRAGSTLFIEPVEVLELNNQLRGAIYDEALEIQEILRDLSQKIKLIADKLCYNLENIFELDEIFAKAIYAYKTKSVKPDVNGKHVVDIKRGRHPLIDKDKVVPLDIRLGEDYNYLLISGPNTGGKTVSLKLLGLCVLMAETGIFLPCASGSCVSVFKNVFCDVGDEQSIEQSLSTFSSHIKNIIHITENADNDSLVLIDEIGAGTDPDEGSCLALAIIKYLLSFKTYGIITTHYSALKEFAMTTKSIMNASMDFDAKTFAPTYNLKTGIPGNSNAIEISSRLGLSDKITADAVSFLSDDKISFENVLKKAEETRRESQRVLDEYKRLMNEARLEYQKAKESRLALEKERENLLANAKSVSRKMINEKVEEADEILQKIIEISKNREIDGGMVITARTLKNRLEDKKYSEDRSERIFDKKPLKTTEIVKNKVVFVNSLQQNGVIVSVNANKKKAFVEVNGIKYNVNFSDLSVAENKESKKTEASPKVIVTRRISNDVVTEINVIGKDKIEALCEVEQFIDGAISHNLNTVRIIHGVGLKVLSTAIHSYLKNNKHVKEYRFGAYGEGENGVTIVTLK